MLVGGLLRADSYRDMTGVLDAVATVALSVFLLVGPALGVLVWRDRWRARRFVPVCRSCGHQGPRGTKNPDRCSVCGEDPDQRRVLREVAAAQQRRGAARLGIRRRAAKPEREAFRRVVLANAFRDIPYLLDALTDPVTRTWAAWYLGKLGEVEAVPALIRLLRAADPNARSAGAIALGRLRALEAVPDLITLAESDQDLAPQSHAIGALAKIGDVRAVGPLLPLLESPSWLIRRDAAHALGLLADTTAIEPLRTAAGRERLLLRGPYRKAVRQIRRRSRSGMFAIKWPVVKPEARRRLLIIGIRLAVFGAIFVAFVKLSPGP
jgi:hypothetical protein